MSTPEPRHRGDRSTLIDPDARRQARVNAALTDPTVGVCTPWATNTDIAGYTPAGDTTDYTSWLAEASELLYALSGRQFPGICTRTVRPITNACRHNFQILEGSGHIVAPPDWSWGIGGWSWGTTYGYGCGMIPAVRLAGYVQAVTAVRISGVTVDPASYRVDQHEWLVRLTDPATGQNPGWPLCQNIALPDDAAGTFAVDYQWGRMPPQSGVRAAATLAWQLYLADNPTRQQCRLPAGWTSIARQGITITRSQVEKLATEGSGIVGIDSFLNTVNPNGLDRAPAVYSRDVPPYGQRTGL